MKWSAQDFTVAIQSRALYGEVKNLVTRIQIEKGSLYFVIATTETTLVAGSSLRFESLSENHSCNDYST